MEFKTCSGCKEYLCEVDMFRKLKNGKHSKKCFNCSGRTVNEFGESMLKVFDNTEACILFNNTFMVK